MHPVSLLHDEIVVTVQYVMMADVQEFHHTQSLRESGAFETTVDHDKGVFSIRPRYAIRTERKRKRGETVVQILPMTGWRMRLGIADNSHRPVGSPSYRIEFRFGWQSRGYATHRLYIFVVCSSFSLASFVSFT